MHNTLDITSKVSKLKVKNRILIKGCGLINKFIVSWLLHGVSLKDSKRLEGPPGPMDLQGTRRDFPELTELVVIKFRRKE
jgi:hypothetical protein